MRKRTLGRGLSDLLSGDTLNQTRSVIEVSLDEIEPNPFQPRQSMDEESLEELTLSIEAYGILQPIIVRRSGPGYQLVAGERRWRAARRAGLRTVPCLVQEADDIQSLEVAMIENLQRDNLNAMEAARGYRQLVEEFGLTQEEVAQKVGKSRSGVANTMRLLDLPEEIQVGIRVGELSEGHGRALLPLVGREDELHLVLERILADGCSVRETERMVKALLDPEAILDQPVAPAAAGPAKSGREMVRDPHIAAAEQRLQSALAAKVAIRPGAKRGGVIHIRYYDLTDLERLLATLGGMNEE